ncbi:MAG TPA: CPBP family intramembrane glutamic endopeptidase [Polyangiaceae bacterium]
MVAGCYQRLMVVVFVRSRSEGEVEAIIPAELKARANVAGSEVAAHEKGPFFALADAPAVPAIRDRVARALDVDAVRRWRRARPWLLLGLFPVVALADLERELIALGTTGVAGRLVADLVLGAFLVSELARPLPRHPRTWAIASFAIATRYAYMITALCGHALPLFWLGLSLSTLAGVLALVTMPAPRALEREVRDALQIPAPAQSRSPTPLAIPLAAAIALPALTFATRAAFGLVVSGIAFVALGLALPYLEKREPAPKRTWIEIADGASFGFAASLAFTRLVHYTTIAISETLRCAAPRAYDAVARPFLERQGGEIARGVTNARAEIFVLALAVALVPVVEERVFRGMLQRALRTRTTSTRAITAASGVFTLAHLGVYRAALHQTFLVGLAFGAAYEESGILAAILAHALYNGAQLL